MSAMYALTVLALVPLALVLWFVASKGAPAVLHPEFLAQLGVTTTT